MTAMVKTGYERFKMSKVMIAYLQKMLIIKKLFDQFAYLIPMCTLCNTISKILCNDNNTNEKILIIRMKNPLSDNTFHVVYRP